jgi:predicted nucleotidyltransferase
MIPEDKIAEFVQRAKAAAGENLESVILYGSAATSDFDPEFSDLNLFCVLRDISFTSLQSLAPVVNWWAGQKQPPPLVMTRSEIERSTDVFTIEFLDMQRHYRVLDGVDVLKGLDIPTHLHRVQIEYELREKLVVLRQRMLLFADNPNQLWTLLLRSAPSFVTLFRHASIALGQPAPEGKRHAVQGLSRALNLDLSALEMVLDVREHKADPRQWDIKQLSNQYLAAIEQVTDAVDKSLESGTLGDQ